MKEYLKFSDRFSFAIWWIRLVTTIPPCLTGIAVIIIPVLEAKIAFTAVTAFFILMFHVFLPYSTRKKTRAFHAFVEALKRKDGKKAVEIAKEHKIYITTGSNPRFNEWPSVHIDHDVTLDANPFDLGVLLASLIHISLVDGLLNEKDMHHVAGSIWNSYSYGNLQYTRIAWFRKIIKGIESSWHSEVATKLVEGLKEHFIETLSKENKEAAEEAIEHSLKTFGKKAPEKQVASRLL